MNKKIILLFIFSLINNSLLYGEDNTEKLVRKSDSIYRMINDKLIKLDNKAVTVKLKEGKELSKNVKAIRSNILGYIDVEVPNNIDIEDYVASLKSTNDYELVKYNEIAEIGVSSNDTNLGNQWYLSTINMFSTWNITTGDPIVKVAVIDNGFDCTHEDIGYGYDNYSNIDLTLGYDYYLMSSTSMTKKDHGTRVAGIISAKTNNGRGIAGVAGGYGSAGVKILPFCVTDGSEKKINFGYVDDAICLAVANGAKVINMSFGSSDTNLSHHIDIVDAIDYAYSHGVTLVSITHNYNNSYVWFPACYSKVIAVGAMDQSYQKSSFSNYGSGIDLVAPGEYIYSTKENGYNYDHGTSFAAPQVAGVAALMLSVNPTLTPSQMKSIINCTCTKLSGYSYDTSGWNSYVGYGLLNAYAAVCAALSSDTIMGPQYFSTSGTYYVNNLPSGVTVEWSLSDSYYNQNCLQQNCPSQNQCTITRSSTQDMMNDTLTATIKYNGVTVQTLTRTGISAFTGFKGTYISSDMGNGQYVAPNPIFTGSNSSVHIWSPRLVGATVTYTGDATPSYWLVGYNTIDVNMPSTGSTILIHVVCEAGDDYYIPVIRSTNPYYLSVNFDGEAMIVTLDDSALDNQSWTLEIYNVMNGEKVVTQNVTGNSVSINISGWKRGLYAARVTIGKEVLTENVVVR